ncbi:hypothetical protein KM043_017452 [Ampulex compressa]|nr:hypothetical protein KM043_017452 [Ampulex compressa]
MTTFNLKELANQLSEEGSKSSSSGVSFTGRQLKLDTEDDALEVINAIQACEKLEYLDLEGNTLGPRAAKAIAEILKVKGTPLKRALWKDMFTGRLKSEIPKTLEFFGTALCTAGTHLIELDLSDNALGPIGIEGLAKFLTSSSCYTLQELRLNNNGLGISGGKMLAQALLDCYENSSKVGNQPLALKVFIAGRNRLENEGAQALAAVFEKLKSLEEVVMLQNGIYYPGITALANGLAVNPKLRILNLNDNTVRTKGARALASILPNFQNLEQLNLGDCLLKTKGALILAKALGVKGNHPSLREVVLSFNEIHARAAVPLAQAMADKASLMSLQLDGNAFGENGRAALRQYLKDSQKIDALGSLAEDNSEDEDEDEESSSEGEEDEDDDFLKSQVGEKLLLLQDDDVEAFIEHAQNISRLSFIEEFTKVIMKVSALCDSGYMDVRLKAESLTDVLYSRLFSYAVENDQVSTLNNVLLVNLDLIKGEDKNSRKIDWNLEGCFKALEKISQREYFPAQTRDTLRLFLDKPMKISRAKVVDPFKDSKISLKAALDRIQTTET